MFTVSFYNDLGHSTRQWDGTSCSLADRHQSFIGRQITAFRRNHSSIPELEAAGSSKNHISGDRNLGHLSYKIRFVLYCKSPKKMTNFSFIIILSFDTT